MAPLEYSLTETKRLGRELLTSRAHVNNVPKLLSILCHSMAPALPSQKSVEGPECRLEALHTLHAFFVPLVRSGKISASARKEASLDIEGRSKRAVMAVSDGGAQCLETRRAEAVYKLWIWGKYAEFVKSLLSILARLSSSYMLQASSLDALMELIRNQHPGKFDNSLYIKVCATLVGSKGFNSDLLQTIITKYLKYSDICYFTCRNMDKLSRRQIGRTELAGIPISSDEENDEIATGVSLDTFACNSYDILSNLPSHLDNGAAGDGAIYELWTSLSDGFVTLTQGCNNEDNESSRPIQTNQIDEKKYKLAFSRAWLTFLQLSLPLDLYKKVLATLHTTIIPFMTNPILLSDFLTNSYNIGGLISVMALSSLFILITKHGLEYPDFYNKLYALLESSIFVAKYRSHFFELLDTCLKSSHLPAYLAGAFAKKLARLVLSAPPSGALVVIALIHNLLRRHPSINCLVHKIESDTIQRFSISETKEVPQVDSQIILASTMIDKKNDTKNGKPGADPFLAHEMETENCNALQSSLWELETLRHHYCPAVSRFVASLETDLTVRAKSTEMAIHDFSSGSYATIFRDEVSRRLKSVPLAFHKAVPCALFEEKEGEGNEDFMGWRFTYVKTSEEHLDDKPHNEPLADHGLEDQFYSQADSLNSEGSRSRSEQSDEEAWSQPHAKKNKGNGVQCMRTL